MSIVILIFKGDIVYGYGVDGLPEPKEFSRSLALMQGQLRTNLIDLNMR